MHLIKVEDNRVEHDVIRARQVLELCLKGFETAGAWTSEDLATKFGNW